MPDAIIKDMEMPETCYCCRANNSVYCFAVPDDADDIVRPYYRARSGKPGWCPLRPAPEWISVEERLPEAEGWYLTFNEASPSGFSNVDKWMPGRWIIAESNMVHVTHWMPLPEPPNDLEPDFGETK